MDKEWRLVFLDKYNRAYRQPHMRRIRRSRSRVWFGRHEAAILDKKRARRSTQEKRHSIRKSNDVKRDILYRASAFEKERAKISALKIAKGKSDFERLWKSFIYSLYKDRRRAYYYSPSQKLKRIRKRKLKPVSLLEISAAVPILLSYANNNTTNNVADNK